MRIGRKKAPLARRQRSSPEPTASGPSFSYHARRSDLNLNTGRKLQRPSRSPLLAKTVAQYWVQRIGSLLLLSVALVCLVSSLSLSTNPRTMPVTTNTPFLQSQAKYQQAAAKLAASSLWNKNKITFNGHALSEGMLKQFPELAHVTVTLPLLGHRPLVYLEPAEPALILQTAGGSYVLDSTGKALLASTAVTASSHLQLPTVTDQSGLPVQMNHQALTSGDVSFIQTVLAQLSAKQLAASAVVLPASSRELDVYIAGQPYYVRFNLITDNARLQAGTFLAALAKLQSQGSSPSKYIDVRVSGRAYYQ